MSRYINNLPNLTTACLTDLYMEGVRSVDAALGGDGCLTVGQVQFVGKLLTRRGVDLDALLDAAFGPGFIPLLNSPERVTQPCPCGGTLEQGLKDRWVWDCFTCGKSVQIEGELGE